MSCADAGPLAPAGAQRPTLEQERRLWRAGHEVVAGRDEVGRGAWAGPLTVGVAVLRPRIRKLPEWLRDSKLLSEDRRERVFEEIAAWCRCWSVGHASAEECDRWGMTAALRLASYRALAGLDCRADALLVDGPLDLLAAPRPRPVQGELELLPPAGRADPATIELPEVGELPLRVPVVDGDARCAAVAAASVLAKVTRDRLMREESAHFPAYCFDANKGYPSAVHQMALRGYGLSAIHRRSWSFVGDLPWR